MRKWTALAAVPTAAALLVGANSAADAAVLTGIYCELSTESEGNVSVVANAYYTDNMDTGIRNWYRFDYWLNVSPYRTKNNVNIRVSESGRRVYSWESPDNRKNGVHYIHYPTRTVHTSIYGPEGEHDHRSNDLIEFTAIFDFDLEGDPRCTAWMKR